GARRNHADSTAAKIGRYSSFCCSIGDDSDTDGMGPVLDASGSGKSNRRERMRPIAGGGLLKLGCWPGRCVCCCCPLPPNTGPDGVWKPCWPLDPPDVAPAGLVKAEPNADSPPPSVCCCCGPVKTGPDGVSKVCTPLGSSCDVDDEDPEPPKPWPKPPLKFCGPEAPEG